MPTRTGLFGKLPTRGDFVRRNLPRSFVEPWDAWLSAGLIAVPNAHWGPWRFHLAAGACGPDGAAGVLAPSQDSVGRRFPLTLAVLGVSHRPPEAWYAALEVLAADVTLDADTLAAALPGLTVGSRLLGSASDIMLKGRPEGAQNYAADPLRPGTFGDDEVGVRNGTPNSLPDLALHGSRGPAPEGEARSTRGALWTADGRQARMEAGFAAILVT